MTKVHRVVLLIVDHDKLGTESIKSVIENQHYPNHCISPSVMEIDTRDVEWHDRHPLNLDGEDRQAFEELFKRGDVR